MREIISASHWCYYNKGDEVVPRLQNSTTEKGRSLPLERHMPTYFSSSHRTTYSNPSHYFNCCSKGVCVCVMCCTSQYLITVTSYTSPPQLPSLTILQIRQRFVCKGYTTIHVTKHGSVFTLSIFTPIHVCICKVVLTKQG